MTVTKAETGRWPVNDIAGLARHVPELDPATYFDEQARQTYEEALVKWPVLARLMGLVPDAGSFEAGERSDGPDGSDGSDESHGPDARLR
ncbi:MAG TPA: hypothetical protein VGZ01_05100 [Trinickia sp.]|jgi:hypothetical protein|nr:hypothetical protein [Trinickia sp.]